MLVHHRVTPSIKFASTHLYTWVERGTVRVKCLAQEHNTMSPARAQTWTARSGEERTNHEATAPPMACSCAFTLSPLIIGTGEKRKENNEKARYLFVTWACTTVNYNSSRSKEMELVIQLNQFIGATTTIVVFMSFLHIKILHCIKIQPESIVRTAKRVFMITAEIPACSLANFYRQ